MAAGLYESRGGEEVEDESELREVCVPAGHELRRGDGEHARGNSRRGCPPQFTGDLWQQSGGQSVRDQVGGQDGGDEVERGRGVEPKTEGEEQGIEGRIGGGRSGLHRAEGIAEGAFVDEGPGFHHHFVSGTKTEAFGMKVLVDSETQAGGEEREETLVLHAGRLSIDASTAALMPEMYGTWQNY